MCSLRAQAITQVISAATAHRISEGKRQLYKTRTIIVHRSEDVIKTRTIIVHRSEDVIKTRTIIVHRSEGVIYLV